MLTLILAVVLVLILLLVVVMFSAKSPNHEMLTPHRDPLALCKIGVQNKQCCWGMFILPAGPHKDPGQIACPSYLVAKTDPAVYVQQGVAASNPQWCVCAGTLGPKSSPYPQCEPNSDANKKVCAWFQE